MRRRQSRLKGQAVFEFVIAVLILFSIIIYVISYLSTSFNLHHDAFTAGRLEGSAMRVSDFLMSNPDEGIVTRWPYIDKDKMTALNTTCGTGDDGYINTLEKFGLKRISPYGRYTHLNIKVTGEDGYTYMNCGRTPFDEGSKGYVTRFGYVTSDHQIAKLEVTTW